MNSDRTVPMAEGSGRARQEREAYSGPTVQVFPLRSVVLQAGSPPPPPRDGDPNEWPDGW